METIEKASVCDRAITHCLNEVDAWRSNRVWLEANRDWIDEVGIEPSFSGTTVFFHNPKHEQAIRIIRAVPGKWDKSYKEASITYTNFADSMRWFYLCDSQPPNTCRLTLAVETVPAHWEPEKVINTFRLECRKEDEPGTADVEVPTDAAPQEELVPA